MKKIICCAVGLVFIALAGFMSYAQSAVSAGAGNGTALKIYTPDEFSAAVYGEGADGQFDSYTLTEDNYVYTEQTNKAATSETAVEKASTTVDNEITYYMTNSAMYIVAEGVYIYSYSLTYNDVSSGIRTEAAKKINYYIDYSFSIFMNEDAIYVYFDRFNLHRVSEDSYSQYDTALARYYANTSEYDSTSWDFYEVVRKYLGQWIDCTQTSDIYYALYLLIGNGSLKDTMCGIIADKADGGEFAYSDNCYTADYVPAASTSTDTPDKEEGYISVDLSSSTNPQVEYYYFYKDSTTQSSTVTGYTYRGDDYKYYKGGLALSNVNNTSAAFESDSEIIVVSAADAEIFVTEMDEIF